MWLGLKQALQVHRDLHRAILLVLLKTSRMAVSAKPVAPVVPSVQPSPVAPIVLPAAWHIPPKMVRRYGRCNVEYLHSWWVQCGPAMLEGTLPLVYVSGVQLFYSFNLSTGYEGPWCHQKRWYSSLEHVPSPARKSWGDRCKLFLLMWKSYHEGPQGPCSAEIGKTAFSCSCQVAGLLQASVD